MERRRYYLTREDRAAFRRRLIAARNQTASIPAQRELSRAEWCGQDWLVFAEDSGLLLAPWKCGKKWCPDCLHDWSDSLKARMIDAVAGKRPKELRHLVLTVPNAPAGGLESRTKLLLRAYREWRNQGRRDKGGGYWKGVLGQAWKLELHWGHRGWHPHLHILVHAPKGLDLMRGEPGREAWPRITETYGARASPTQGIYVTMPKTAAGVVAEVAKYAAKPIPIRDLPIARISEAVSAFHKQHFHGSSGTLSLGPGKQPGEGNCIFLGSARALVARGLERDAKPDDIELGNETLAAVAAITEGREPPTRWRSLLEGFAPF